MKRLLPSLVALLLAACATGSKTDGSNAQVEVDSHGLLGDIAFERQQLDTAANEYLAAALLRRQSIGEFLASYDTPEGIVSLFAYFGFAVMPLTGGRSALGT